MAEAISQTQEAIAMAEAISEGWRLRLLLTKCPNFGSFGCKTATGWFIARVICLILCSQNNRMSFVLANDLQ